jgi:hypothetical protein
MPQTALNDRTYMLKNARYKFVRVFSGDTLGQGDNTNSNFIAQLYNDTNLGKVREFTIQSACIPNVFPNIKGLSIFLSYIPLVGPPVAVSVAVLDGQYTTAQLMASLKNEIDAILPVGSSVTFTQDPISQKIIFSATNLTSIEFFDVVSNPLSTLAPKLGINITQPPATSGTFDSIPSLAGEQYIFINSQTLNLSKTRLSNGLGVSAIVSVPVNVQYGQNIYYQNTGDLTNDVIFNAPTDLTNINITLRNQDGSIPELPDNHPMTLILKVFY